MLKATKEQIEVFYQQVESFTDMVATAKAGEMFEYIKSSIQHKISDSTTFIENQKDVYNKKIQSDDFGNTYEWHKKKNNPIFQSQLLCDDFTEQEIISGDEISFLMKPVIQKLVEFKTNLKIIELLNAEIENKSKLKPNKWNEVYEDFINNYFKNASIENFTFVMKSKHLDEGQGQIIWISDNKYECVLFGKEHGFSMKQLKECFIYKDKTSFTRSNLTIKPGKLESKQYKKYMDLLRKHRDK